MAVRYQARHRKRSANARGIGRRRQRDAHPDDAARSGVEVLSAADVRALHESPTTKYPRPARHEHVTYVGRTRASTPEGPECRADQREPEMGGGWVIHARTEAYSATGAAHWLKSALPGGACVRRPRRRAMTLNGLLYG